MKKSRILTIIGGLSVIGYFIYAILTSTAISAYSVTDFTLNTTPTPTVSIAMDQSIVGDNHLNQVEGLPSSTSFYKPVGINVSDVKSYYVSVFLDCSALSGNDKAKCEAGDLLTSSGDTLTSVSSAKTFSTMNNEWGFRYNIGSSVQDLSEKHFTALPTNRDSGFLQINGEEQIKTPNGTSDNKTLTLGFGAKINGNTATGTYNGKVTVAVVASPADAVFGGIASMQQLNHNICTKASIHDTSYLKDERDNKKYWVTKLEDGHCWMSQNLDLEIGVSGSNNVVAGTSTVLNSSNTDVGSGNVTGLKATTNDVKTGAAQESGTESKYSWDQGLWVINDPLPAATACTNDTGIKDCTMFTDVSSGWTAAEDPNFTNLSNYKQGNTTYTKTAGSPLDTTNKIYGAHYLVGNYYQYNTATAGSGDGLTNADAPNSLCPKGWKLPSSNTRDDVANRGSFYYMLNQYKVAGSLTGTLGNRTTNIAMSPLFYVRSGFVSPNNNTPFSSAGMNGSNWSARTNTVSNVSYAYYLLFTTIDVRPSQNDWRWFGRSVRCVMY